jgi:PPM family protein phosphatase
MVAAGSPVRFGARSVVGRVREHNEDAFAICEDLGFAVVCDGMGGHARGEVASRLAVDTVVEAVQAAAATREVDAAAGILAQGIEQANLRVHAAGGPVASRLRMGTTVVAIWIVAGHAHVGDSRCYRLRGGGLHRLTADHTFLEEARRHELGGIDDDMVRHFAHVLTRSVGQAPGCAMDLARCRVAPGDRFLLCTDGLTGLLDDAAIASILRTAESPEAAARRLADEANVRGGNDNITAVVVWVAA